MQGSEYQLSVCLERRKENPLLTKGLVQLLKQEIKPELNYAVD